MELLKELRKTSIKRQGVRHYGDTPTLVVSDLSLRYESSLALDNISFRLEAGERVALVGPNGAGKSTLFKVIAGVLPPTGGEVKVFGHGPSGHICIAYLPQRSQVDWNFPASVADVVMMGRIRRLGPFRWPKREDWDFVLHSLAEVGLDSLAKRQISELSGGQQQRMFIARALAQEAELMLMDEPLSGLDVNSQDAIFSILDQLRKKGVTVMVATHDLDQAAGLFDRVMLLNRQLLGIGPPAQVFTKAKLIAAYGGHLQLFSEGNEILALTDTCCDEGEEGL